MYSLRMSMFSIPNWGRMPGRSSFTPAIQFQQRGEELENTRNKSMTNKLCPKHTLVFTSTSDDKHIGLEVGLNCNIILDTSVFQNKRKT
jgi:hypothetical protein